MPNFGTVQDAAEKLGLSTKTIRHYIADGTIKAYRVGPKLIRIDMDALTAILAPVTA